mgnify:CR=1 FL=1|tara:strand:+ start:5999 stop:6460 length:462 start_codon:yes stop_codon:yes gene_type:complete
MRINFDRMSRLAGLSTGTNRKSLKEGAEMHYEVEDDAGNEGTDMDGLMSEEDEEDDADEDMDEMIEIDEVMLVQELRRAKGIMQESKRRRLSESRKRQIFEKQIKQVIDEEVANVMDEMNLSAGWVYGDNKPKRSRKGYTNQGSMLPGLGFKR